MTTLISIFLVIHLLGFGALFGGLLIQAREPQKKVNALMRDGVGTALVAGLILFGLDSAHDHPGAEWHWKMSVKLVVALIITALVMINMRKPRIPQGLWAGLLALTVLNVCVAAIWHAN